jgi:hypothetical protein
VKSTCKNTLLDINLNQKKLKFSTEMKNPLNQVKQTRQRYDKQLNQPVTEVLVQFKNENPAWVPLETLLAIKSQND